jgi:uncharacterized protein (TIGR00255 family)
MPIRSMTGFARSKGLLGPIAWSFEVRSVNGRGLDVRTRLPAGYEELEPLIRTASATRLSRGSINVLMHVEAQKTESEIRINREVLDQILAATEAIEQSSGRERVRLDSLLGLKGVLEVVEKPESEAERAERISAMLATYEEALGSLVETREAEGARLADVLSKQLDEIERLMRIVEVAPARSVDAVAARLREQIARLVETSDSFDAQRLHQEAVLIATRADVEEEIKRLAAHISAARELIDDKGSVGRKLDFLAQEFHREANTLCSKSNDIEITRAGLAMKVIIDQMREQVQNIE